MNRHLVFSFFILVFLLAACTAGLANNDPEIIQDESSQPLAVEAEVATPTASVEDELANEVTANPEATLEPEIDTLPTRRPRRLRAGELQLAADVDDIPAIFAEDDIFVDVASGDEEWQDEELVIGLELNGDVRAYPVRLLSLHEIVNDTVGGQPVAITWCPLCFSAIVFDRNVAGKELTFGVSGFLYFNNLVMYDHRSNTLWSQMLGEGIKGAFRGERLDIIPSLMTSWADWKEQHPDTLVLSAVEMGRNEEVLDPYAGYYTGGGIGVTGWANPNELLDPKELVVGIEVGGTARGYPLGLIYEQGIVNDTLNTLPLVLVFDPALETATVYRAEAGDMKLSFTSATVSSLMQDEQTGTLWEIGTGLATEGPLAGTRLSRVAAPLVFWFAWSDIHPKSDVFGP